MKATKIDYFVYGGRGEGVRITADDGKTYAFCLEWQKLLANDIKAALVNPDMGDSYSESVPKLPEDFGPVGQAQWVYDPVICKIVNDARKAGIDGTFEPGPVPISRYYPEVGEP